MSEASIFAQSTRPSRLRIVSDPLETVSPSSLVTRRRYDLAVKYNLFRCRLSDSEFDEADAERVYRWHIKKRRASGFIDAEKQEYGVDQTLDRYVADARRLLMSMTIFGFDPQFAIPVDPSGEILGGAHRLAAALALGLNEVPVRCMDQAAWSPDWGCQWFVDQGMGEDDLQRLERNWRVIHGRVSL